MIQIALEKIITSKKHHFEFKVNANIESPQIIGVSGNSGTGKTTFFRMLSGLTTSDAGYIHVNEEVWYHHEQKLTKPVKDRSCSYLFQSATLFNHLTLKENIRFANSKVSEVEIEAWFSALNILSLKNLYPNELSGGQQKRAAFVMTLVNTTNIILLDEPFVALDEEAKELVLTSIKRVFNDRKCVIFIASHDKTLLKSLCHKVYEIKDGKLDIN